LLRKKEIESGWLSPCTSYLKRRREKRDKIDRERGGKGEIVIEKELSSMYSLFSFF
jgi:hypothetical protein